MAVTLNVGEDKRRGDTYFVNPFDVIVKDELRGRHIPPTPEQIVERAVSMLTHGQLQPVQCRKDSEHRPVVILGFTRTAAARLIREGFEHDGQTYKDENFLLQLSLVDCNDEEAFTKNIVENAHRNETTPIDDAHNQRRLREMYAKTDAEIARTYGYGSSNRVMQYKRLLGLSREEQLLVHEGKLSVSAALDLLDAPADQRAEFLASATKDNGKIDGSALRDVVREHILSDGPDGESNARVVAPVADGPVEETKFKPRSMKQVKAALQDFIDAEDTSEEIKAFCKTMLAFIAGRKGTRALSNALDNIAA